MKLLRRTLMAAAGGALLPARAAGGVRLVVPLAAAPEGLIPGLSDQAGSRLVGTKLYQGLIRFSPALEPLPELATAWEVSPDGLTVRFALRPGVTWHDGAPFTAEDVAFSLDRFHRLASPRLGPLLRPVVGVRAEGQSAVVMLDAPFPSLLSLLDACSAPIVPRHIHDRAGFALEPDPLRAQPVGTGPFRLASWLRLVRFDGYAGPAPALDEIVFPILADPAARLAATQTGQPVLLAADALALSAIPRLRQQGMAVAGQVVPNHAMLAWLDLNHAAPPLDDARVRLALAYAVDRGAILRDVWGGLGRVASGPIPERAGAEGPGLPPYDPRAAAGQLDAAGLRPDDRGVRLRIRHLVRAAEPWPRLAAALRGMLEQVGVEMTLDMAEPAQWARQVAAQDYQTTAMVAEYSGTALASDMRRRLVDDVAQVWLVEPALPVAADRRLRAPGGVYSSFADADLTG